MLHVVVVEGPEVHSENISRAWTARVDQEKGGNLSVRVSLPLPEFKRGRGV